MISLLQGTLLFERLILLGEPIARETGKSALVQISKPVVWLLNTEPARRRAKAKQTPEKVRRRQSA